MKLTEKQELGLKIAVERYKNKEKYTVISGYAGTGKSTLVRFIVDALGVDPDYDVAYATFTGKAAENLAHKGNKGACTLHKLLYTTKPLADGTFIHIPKDAIKEKVVVVDEVSMAPSEMVHLLLSMPNVYVLFCGDPGQLPPISEDDNNHLLDNPHIFLDEIMRQAQDSGIIQLSQMIRNGEDYSNFKSADAIVINKSDLVSGMLTWADQIICATNSTRNNLNCTVRKLLGFDGDEIQDGDKVICLKNYWNLIGDDGNPLVNGSIGTIHLPRKDVKYRPRFRGLPSLAIQGVTSMGFTSETNEFYDMQLFMDGNLMKGMSAPQLNGKDIYKMKQWKITKSMIPYEFTLGYAITAWKAQGSQWEKVLVFEEGFPYGEEHKKFLYTAVTRAEKGVVLVLNK